MTISCDEGADSPMELEGLRMPIVYAKAMVEFRGKLQARDLA